MFDFLTFNIFETLFVNSVILGLLLINFLIFSRTFSNLWWIKFRIHFSKFHEFMQIRSNINSRRVLEWLVLRHKKGQNFRAVTPDCAFVLLFDVRVFAQVMTSVTLARRFGSLQNVCSLVINACAFNMHKHPMAFFQIVARF